MLHWKSVKGNIYIDSSLKSNPWTYKIKDLKGEKFIAAE